MQGNQLFHSRANKKYSLLFLPKTRTPIITSVPSEDHTYSAGGGSSGSSSASSTVANTPSHKPANTLNTIIINTDQRDIEYHIQTENVVTRTPPPDNFNSSSISSNHIVRHTNETIDNRNSDNVSNGTSSDAAYESSEEG